MASEDTIGVDLFRADLTDGDVRTLQLVHVGLALGSALFAVLVVALSVVQPGAGDAARSGNGQDVVRLLTIVHAVAACVAYLVGTVAYGSILRRRLPSDGTDACMQAIKGATIVRLSIFEMPAFLGMITCLMANFAGTLSQEPLYWLNASTTVIFIVFVLATFPTRQGLVEVFERFARQATNETSGGAYA